VPSVWIRSAKSVSPAQAVRSANRSTATLSSICSPRHRTLGHKRAEDRWCGKVGRGLGMLFGQSVQ